MDSARIMVVEDNTAVAEDCRECLEALGYGVAAVVPSGEEAVILAEKERPDAVLMDIHLRDELDGIEAAEQIRDKFGIPVIFLSAYSDRDLLERTKRVGSFGYLVKPFEERELYAALETALFRAQAEREHRDMEARLRQAQKMDGLRLMAGSVAHNFNNILQGALGYTELALAELPVGSKARDHLLKADKAMTRAAEMSTLMLVYVGQGQEEMTVTSLSALIQGAQERLQSLTVGHASLSINLSPDDAVIDVDPVQVHQLIVNLVTNSVEAIKETGESNGTITLSTWTMVLDARTLEETYLHEPLPAGPYCMLEVADTGCGMDPEALARIFDPFFTTKFPGRGLGLAAILGIVRGHRGAITVESKPGKGATFRVLFPVSEKNGSAAVATPDLPEERPERATILVVDDERAVRDIGVRMLERAGYATLAAGEGREAVELLREHTDTIDCVLLDRTMPGWSGVQTFHEMRRVRPDLRIILCSGHEELEATRSFAGEGLTGFLHKPYRSQTLLLKIREVLSAES
jgi:CheY-like chemotaxis protein/nitrogen-specific signal transduction histidine kinase